MHTKWNAAARVFEPSVVYDRLEGRVLNLPPVDCREAVASQPDRYSHTPWPTEEGEKSPEAPALEVAPGALPKIRRKPGPKPKNQSGELTDGT
jgi:hypothetical protein